MLDNLCSSAVPPLQIFTARYAIRSVDYTVARCLSVSPSVTRQYSVKTAKHVVKLIHPRVAIPF